MTKTPHSDLTRGNDKTVSHVTDSPSDSYARGYEKSLGTGVTSDTATIQHLANHAAWLAQNYPDFHESRLKGTPRRWKQRDTKPHDQNGGFTPSAGAAAPLHLDVFDLLTNIETTARTIAQQIQATGINAKPEANNTLEHLRYISRYAQVLPEDETTKSHSEALRSYRRSINDQWADIFIGQRIKAPCPWCGQEKLKIRTIGPEHAPEQVVRCESGTCEPPPEDCGTWFRGPCWPLHEWEWLAGRLDYNLQQQSQPTSPAPTHRTNHQPNNHSGRA